MKNTIDVNNFGLDETKAKELSEKIENYILIEVEKRTKEAEASFQKQFAVIKNKSIVEQELSLAGARNLKAVFALLEITEEELQNLDLNSIKQKIKQLKEDESTKFLFNQKQDNLQLKGVRPFESNIDKPKSSRYMDYEELCEYYQNMYNL